VKLMYIYIS